ncbi:MAG: transposase [Verrucomicrobia bacterium]|nr:transposase [Verrucomicrobiota bacterium]
MDLPVRKKLPHQIPPWVEEGSFFFTTICCREKGRNQLCHDDAGQKVLSTVAYYHEHLKWHCVLFVLMPDHAHGILSFPREPGVAATIKAWKSYQKRFHGIEWQEGFFDHRLRDRFSLEEKLAYVLQNPVRKGLCARPEDWPYVYRPADRPVWLKNW